jgi:hypothetical protein
MEPAAILSIAANLIGRMQFLPSLSFDKAFIMPRPIAARGPMFQFEYNNRRSLFMLSEENHVTPRRGGGQLVFQN